MKLLLLSLCISTTSFCMETIRSRVPSFPGLRSLPHRFIALFEHKNKHKKAGTVLMSVEEKPDQTHVPSRSEKSSEPLYVATKGLGDDFSGWDYNGSNSKCDKDTEK